ncbi:MAG: phosphoribosyltransferase [Blastocatellia bacterium]
MLAPVPDFSKVIQAHLRRTAWGDFPDVIIHADESIVKKHSLYPSAKQGNSDDAEALVLETCTLGALDRISALVGQSRPFLLAVNALESEGVNVIPRVLARFLSKILDLPLANGVLQINRVTHTGADGYHRLALPALFDGEVREGEYLLVDDFVGQGGTLANLKGLLESHARVMGATTLTGKAYSAKLRLEPETLRTLREKHGSELEEWWLATFGYGFERLTESEARYLTRADDAHAISTRIVAAMRG